MTIQNVIRCPACGSESFSVDQVTGSIPVPYTTPATFMETVYICNQCGCDGDFTGENEAVISAALDKSTSISVVLMLGHLAAQGIIQADFERCLRLPMQTTAHWKMGKISASELALLRIIRTFPWILRVADTNFANWRDNVNSESNTKG